MEFDINFNPQEFFKKAQLSSKSDDPETKIEFSGIEASQSLVPHRRALRANFLSLSGDI